MRPLIFWTQLLVLGAGVVSAQDKDQVEALQRQLRQMQEQFERVQREQRAQIEALQKQIEALKQAAPVATPTTNPTAVPADGGVAPASPPGAGAGAVAPSAWSPTDPIPLVRRGSSFLNLSLDALFSAGTSTADDIEPLQLGAHDPNQRGFTLQNIEATFDGVVDPYFRGQANIIYQIDAEGESLLEVEEAFLQTLSLPANLQLKAGQYFTEFGRHNPTHPHMWSFVDQPLVNGRFLGPDGLRNPGARVSWLVPTPFYSELFLSVQNSHGETAHSFRSDHEEERFLGRFHEAGRVGSLGDLLFVPRYAASFDLTDSQTLLAGASAAFGPNGSGASADTQIYGVDLFWKWKPVTHSGGFPFVAWQTEAMLRRFETGAFDGDADGDGAPDFLPREILTDYGFYTQLTYGFRKGWVTGLRLDYVTSDDAKYERILGRDLDRAERWRLSPNLTWYPSEFSKVRLQYNYDDRAQIGADHSIWLQMEFLLGSHGAHRF